MSIAGLTKSKIKLNTKEVMRGMFFLFKGHLNYKLKKERPLTLGNPGKDEMQIFEFKDANKLLTWTVELDFCT